MSVPTSEVAAAASRLVADALMFRNAPPARTTRFKPLRHDRHLLPGVQTRLQRLFDGFHRDTTCTYDIQGMKDEGTDILVRLSPEGSDENRYLSFQVKSHIELTAKGLASELLLQWQRSEDKFSPLHYYILLFADATSLPHLKAIRSVQSAFAKKKAVTVVTPGQLLTFWTMRSETMSALVTSVGRRGDTLVAEARESLLVLDTAPQAALVLVAAAAVVDGDHAASVTSLRTSEWFYRLLCGVKPLLGSARYDGLAPTRSQVAASLRSRRASPTDPSNFAERLPPLLDFMENTLDVEDETVRLPVQDWLPLLSIMFEGAAKWGEHGDGLIRFTLDVLMGNEDLG